MAGQLSALILRLTHNCQQQYTHSVTHKPETNLVDKPGTLCMNVCENVLAFNGSVIHWGGDAHARTTHAITHARTHKHKHTMYCIYS